MKGSAAVGLFLALSLPLMVGAQVADTLAVTIEGDLAGVVFETFEVKLRIGDTIQYVAQAYDSEGDPVTIEIVYTYATSDPTFLSIDAETGLAVALRKATPADTLLVLVRAEYGGLVLRVASFRDGLLNWSGHDTIFRPVDSLGNLIGPPPTLQKCAYLVAEDGYLVAQSEPPPLCPLAIPERPEAPAYPMFTRISRIRPELFLLGTPGQG